MSQYRMMGRLLTFATLGALASAGCFVVDDKKKDDDGDAGADSGGTGGITGTGGSKSTGGVAGTGTSTGGTGTAGTGTESGGTGTAGTGTAGTGTAGTGNPPGGAVMKFCNDLTKNSADVTLTVDFGGVRASTITGTCTPVVPNPCITIPTGADIPANLYDGTTLLYEAAFTLVEAGDEILVIATLDDAMTAPALIGGPFNTGYVCATTDPFAAAFEAKSADLGAASFTHLLKSERSASMIRHGVASKLGGYERVTE